MMPIRLVILALVVALAVPGKVSADYTFEFYDPVNSVFTQSFNVNVGQTVTVQVYLAQTGSTSGLTTSGLSSGGVALTGFSTSTAYVSGITPNSAANGGQFDYGTTSGGGSGSTQAGLNVGQLTSPAVTGSAILLGSFTFTGVSAGTAYIQTALPNPDPPYANNVLATSPTPTNIDGMIDAYSGTITVNAVPEPGTLILSGLLAAGMAGGVARRLRRKTVVA